MTVVHVCIVDRLEGVSGRYTELSERTAEHLDRMQHALPLAERFHDTHDQLLNVLQRVEPELRGAEVTGPEAEAQVNVSTTLLSFCLVFVRLGGD